MSTNKSTWKKLTSMRLFMPLVCLLAIIIVATITIPGFLSMSLKNGVPYGYPVDVINRAGYFVSWYDTCYSSFRRTGHQCRSCYGSRSSCMLPDPFRWGSICKLSVSTDYRCIPCSTGCFRNLRCI